MQTLTRTFNGLNNRLEPHLIGAAQAQDLSNVVLDSQGLRPLAGPGAAVATAGGTIRSMYKYGGQTILSTENRQYVEFGGLLYYALAGSRPKASNDGVTFYSLGMDAPTAAPTVASAGGGVLNGTYQYYITNVHTLGWESAPSPASASFTAATNSATVTFAVGPAGTAKRRIYRAGGGASGVLRVTEIADNVTTSYTDNTADTALGVAITTASHAVPTDFDGMCVTPYGVALGWKGKRLYYSEQGFLNAWPVTNYIDYPEDIEAVLPYSGVAMVLTVAAPYALLGTNKSTYRIQNIPSQQGCIDRDTAIDMGAYVMYRSPDGLVALQMNSAELLTKTSLSDEYVASIPTTWNKAIRYNDRYLLFWDTGFLEYDPRLTPSWKKGTVGADAVHYSRTDDTLFIADGTEMKEWAAGADLTYIYRTGDWSGEVATNTKHYRNFALKHDGSVTARVFVNDTNVGGDYNFTRSDLGVSEAPLPMGAWGDRVSVEIEGTGKVIEILVGYTDMGQVRDESS